jgi:hypothetical protein
MDEKAILRLLIEETKQPINISRSAQIGRASSLTWAVDGREMPDEFCDLEIAISLLKHRGSSTTSRNHFAILSDKDDNFYIMDLRSINGTYLNGNEIPPAQRYILSHGDKIRAGGVNINVEGKITGENRNRAILIGSDLEGRHGSKKSLDDLEVELSRRGFKDNIIRFVDGEDTKSQLRGYLQSLTPLTTEDSRILVYYAGVGQEGICLGGEEVVANDIYPLLMNLRGKKAVLLDCKDAKDFLGYERPLENMLVIGSQPQDDPESCIEGAFIGQLTQNLIYYLQNTPGKLNLKVLKDHLKDICDEKDYGFVDNLALIGKDTFIVASHIDLTQIYNSGQFKPDYNPDLDPSSK